MKDGVKKKKNSYHGLITEGNFMHFPLANQWMDVPVAVGRSLLTDCT